MSSIPPLLARVPDDPEAAPAARAEARVHVTSPDGQAGTIAASDVRQAEQAGYVIHTDEQAREADLQAKYGTAGGQAKAALLGGLSGATMGLSNIALTQSGLVSPETLENLEEANPTTSTAAEVGGNIAPLLLSGGTSAVARGVSALGTPVRLAGQAGEHVAEGIAKQFVKAGIRADSANMLARAAARVAPQAIGSASEGAIYGAAQALNEEALGEPGTIGEKLIANVGLASFFGGAVGGAAGLLTGTVAKHVLHGEGHVPGRLAREAAEAGNVSRATFDAAEGTAAHEGVGASEAVAQGVDADAAKVARETGDGGALGTDEINAGIVPTENTLEVPGSAASQTAPIDPLSPEGVRHQAAELGAALQQEHMPPGPAAGFDHSAIDATLAGAGAAKGVNGNALSRMVERVTGTDLAKGVADKWAKMSAAFTGTDAETIRAMTTGKGAAELRNLAVKSAEHIDKEVRTGVEHLNDFGRHMDTLEELTLGADKIRQAAKIIPPGNEVAATQQVMGMMASARQQLAALSKDKVLNKAYLERAQDIVDAYEARVLSMTSPGKVHPDVEKYGLSAALFDQADKLKRDLGYRTFKGLKRTMGAGDKETYLALSDIYTKTLIPALEDSSVWGDMGLRQAAINKRWNKMLATQRYVKGDLLTVYGDKLDGSGRNYVADPAKLNNFYHSLSDPKNDVTLARLREHLQDKMAFIEEAEKHAVYGKDALATAAAAKENVKQLQAQLDRVQKTIAARNQLEQLTKGSIAFNTSGAGLAGAALGGPVGALIGMATSTFVSPAKVIRQLAAMDSLVAKTDAAIGHSLDNALGATLGIGKDVKAGAAASVEGAGHIHRPHAEHAGEHGHGFLHRAEEAARRLGDHTVEAIHAVGHEEAREEAKGHGAATHLGRGGQGAHDGHYKPGHEHETTVRRHTESAESAPPKRAVQGVTGPLQTVVHAIGSGRFDDEGDSAPAERQGPKTMSDRIDNFRKLQLKLMDSMSDMGSVMDRLHQNTSELSQVAPNTAAATNMTLAAGINFLASKMPHPTSSPLPPSLRRPFTPSEEDMDKMDRYARVVQDPLSAVQDLGEGKLTFEAVEALKAVYPNLHTAIVNKAMEKLQTWPDAIPYAKKVQLGTLLGAPLDDSMLPSTLTLMGNNGVPLSLSPPQAASAVSTGQTAAAMPHSTRVNTGQLSKMDHSSRVQTRSQQLEENTE